MAAYQDLVAAAAPALRRLEGRDRPRVAVAVDTSSIASGARETHAALRAEIERRGLDLDLDQAGGTGLSFADPVVQVTKADGTKVLYQHVTGADAADFVAAVLVRDDDHGRWVLGALHGSPGEHIPSMAD